MDRRHDWEWHPDHIRRWRVQTPPTFKNRSRREVRPRVSKFGHTVLNNLQGADPDWDFMWNWPEEHSSL